MEKSLRDILNRLPIPGLKDSNDRHTMAAILSRELSFPVKANQISVKDRILSVSVPPVLKSAIQVKKQNLIEVFSKEGITLNSIR